MAFIPTRLSGRRPVLLSFRSSKPFILFVICYAIFVDQFVFAVILPVMPFSLHEQIGISESSVQYWVSVLLSIYGVALFAASPLWGWYTDRTSSRRIPFLLSLFITLGSTIMIWRATTIGLQITGRLLQGFAAASVYITSLAMIADTMKQSEVGQGLGYLGIAMMSGTLVAPLLGGVVFARVGYDAVFEMTLGLIFIDILLRLVTVERNVAQKWKEQIASEDTFQLEKAVGEASSGNSTPDQASVKQEHQVTEAYLGSSGTLSPSKVRRRARLPTALRLLASHRIISAIWGTVIAAALFSGLETVLPLQTQAVFGWNSEGGGLIFLPLTLTAFFGPIVGWICDKYGSRWPICIGFLLLCPSLTLLRLIEHNTLQQKALLCVLLTLVGCCFTMTINPLMAEVAYVVEQKAKDDPETYGSANKAYAQAFSLYTMAYSMGSVIGPLVAGLIRENAGWNTMTWVLGLLGGVTAAVTGLWCGGWFFGRRNMG